MKGKLLERFRNNASFAQILMFEKLQEAYDKGGATYEECQLWIVFCSATIVKNERNQEMLR